MARTGSTGWGSTGWSTGRRNNSVATVFGGSLCCVWPAPCQDRGETGVFRGCFWVKIARFRFGRLRIFTAIGRSRRWHSSVDCSQNGNCIEDANAAADWIYHFKVADAWSHRVAWRERTADRRPPERAVIIVYICSICCQAFLRRCAKYFGCAAQGL